MVEAPYLLDYTRYQEESQFPGFPVAAPGWREAQHTERPSFLGPETRPPPQAQHPKEDEYPAEGGDRGEKEGEPAEGSPAPCLGSLSLGSLSPFGDCFSGSLEPEEDGMFLSLPRGKTFFFLHKNVKLHNPIGNLDRLQLAAWVLLLGNIGRRREKGG